MSDWLTKKVFKSWGQTGKSDDRVGHLNAILARGGGNLNDPILKSSNACGLPGRGGGMLKFRVETKNCGLITECCVMLFICLSSSYMYSADVDLLYPPTHILTEDNHNTGNFIPYSSRILCGFFNVPQGTNEHGRYLRDGAYGF